MRSRREYVLIFVSVYHTQYLELVVATLVADQPGRHSGLKINAEAVITNLNGKITLEEKEFYGCTDSCSEFENA